MTEQEAKSQQKRISDYNKLILIRQQINEAIKRMDEPCDGSVHQAGPFTGNTRESRRITSMEINFSKTRGGAPAISRYFTELNIEACDIGQAIVSALAKKCKQVNEEIENL